MKKGRIIQEILSLILIAIFLIWILYKNNLFYWLAFSLVLVFFSINSLIILINERKYKKNRLFLLKKSKKSTINKILIGLLAGLHYTFFIGTYNHKKYNTQINYPETLECIFGNASQNLIIAFFMIISFILIERIHYYLLLILSIPLITNIISLILKKYKSR